jgi:hypothetical protein
VNTSGLSGRSAKWICASAVAAAAARMVGIKAFPQAFAPA